MKRRSYTDEQRRLVIKFAKRDGLTGLDVQRKFGVDPATYYRWVIAASRGANARGDRLRHSPRPPRKSEPLERQRPSSADPPKSDIPAGVLERARQLLPKVAPWGMGWQIGLVRALREAGLHPLEQIEAPLADTRRRRKSEPAGTPARSFTWQFRPEGWANNHRGQAIHYWRHARSLCGAYEWREEDGAPRIERTPELARGEFRKTPCARCLKRSSSSRMRFLSRDRNL